MPLTSKGEKIERTLKEEYGPKKGEEVLYAGKNAGTFTGIDSKLTDSQRANINAIMDSRRERLAGDGAFQKLENKLSHEKGVNDPAAVAAAAGREKYGNEEMAKKAEAGRK